MQTLANGIEVPTNSDAYKLTEDLAKMGDTANVVKGVSSASDRDTYQAALPDRVPLIVARTDVPGLPLELWDGAKWHRYSRFYARSVGGGALSPLVAGQTIGPVPVTFPAGRFSVPPLVQIGCDQTRVTIIAADVTTTGFNIYATNVTAFSSTSGWFRWSADQATATNADG